MAYKPEVQPLFDQYEARMEKAVAFLKNDLSLIRAGRANPQVLSKITVNYYGTPTPLVQMANITVPEARMLLISLWDASAMRDVTKAILASDLGINPTDDGKSIRLVFPQLTEERRKELIKQVKKNCEESKVVLRNERRDAMEAVKKLKNDKAISEDEEKAFGADIQKLLDKRIEAVDKVLKEKEAEILEV
ncbi:MAG: ribosome recycling factor [Firmicutes bacterium]|nr:ribosome recycling factor [Bacillota bacterium]